MFYKLVGHSDTSDVWRIVVVGHKLQHGTSHSSFTTPSSTVTIRLNVCPISCSISSSIGLTKRRS